MTSFLPRLALGAALLLPCAAFAGLPAGAPTVSTERPLDAIDYEGSPHTQANPCVAFDGTNYSVAWNGAVWKYGPLGTRTAHVSPAGTVLDPEGTFIQNSTQTPIQQVVVGGVRSFFVMDGADNQAILMTRVDATGNVLGTANVVAATPPGNLVAFSVGASADHIVVSYDDGTAIGVVVLDATGTVVTTKPSLLPRAATVLAVGPQGFLLATTTAATRYAFDGTVLGSTTLPPATNPVVAATGATDYLLVVGQATATGPVLAGVRLTFTGALEDATPIALGSGFNVAAAWNGSAWQLTWTSTATMPYQIIAAQLGSNGTVTAAAPVAAGASETSLTAGPAGQTLVAWTGSSFDVLGVRLGPTGSPLDAQPILISTVARPENAPVIARGQGGYLAVWTSTDRGILARRFDDSGTSLDAAPIVVTSTVQSAQLVAGRDEYFVSWQGPSGAVGVRIGADGTVRDASPIALPGFLVASGGGQFLTFGSDLALLDASGKQVVAPFPIEPAVQGIYVAQSVAGAWNGSSFDLVWADYDNVYRTYDIHTALVAPTGTLTALPRLATGLHPLEGVQVQAVATGAGQVVLGWYGGAATQGLQRVDAKGAAIGSVLSLAGTVDALPVLASDAAGRALVVWQADETFLAPRDVFATSLSQAVAVDFTSSPPVIGTPFALTSSSYAFGTAVAADGASGLTFVVRSSTPSLWRMPRAAMQTVRIPVPPPACGDDGGACAPDGGTSANEAGAPEGGTKANDAGAPDARRGGGVDAGAGQGASNGATSSTSGGGCGCTVVPIEMGRGPLLLALIAAAVLGGRRRRAS